MPSGGDNFTATFKTEWATPTSDWDMRLYERRRLERHGHRRATSEVAASEQGTTDFEQTTIADALVAPGRSTCVRMTNFAATEPYEGTVTFGGPTGVQAAQKEAWTLTCENSGGTVFKTQQVIIDRGQRQSYDFAGCGLAASGKDKREKPRVKSRMSAKRSGRYFLVKVKGGLVSVGDKGNPLPQGSKARALRRDDEDRRQGQAQDAQGRRGPKVNSRCKFSRTIKVKRTAGVAGDARQPPAEPAERLALQRQQVPAAREEDARASG